jgi:hypothetical protein
LPFPFLHFLQLRFTYCTVHHFPLGPTHPHRRFD